MLFRSGNERGLIVGRVPTATGDDHIDTAPQSGSIRIDFTSLKTHIENGLYVTGSVTSSITNAVGFFGTASYAVSSSAATSITFIPSTASFATTASYVNPSGLPIGIVSSSTQINTGSFTGSFIGNHTGSLLGTSSWASNAITASFSTTASAATSITFIPSTASFSTTASAATSITFTPSTASFATTASYVYPSGLPIGTVSSSIQINTGSFTGSFVGGHTGS